MLEQVEGGQSEIREGDAKLVLWTDLLHNRLAMRLEGASRGSSGCRSGLDESGPVDRAMCFVPVDSWRCRHSEQNMPTGWWGQVWFPHAASPGESWGAGCSAEEGGWPLGPIKRGVTKGISGRRVWIVGNHGWSCGINYLSQRWMRGSMDNLHLYLKVLLGDGDCPRCSRGE